MSFKKRGSSKWTDAPHYIMGTSTDTITTLPADLYADGNNATVDLKGNMEQSSTPTPDNPVMPQETGERTINLFDKTSEYIKGTATYNYTISGLDPNKNYTCSTNFERISGVTTASIYFKDGKSNINGVWSDTPRTFKPDSNGKIMVYLRYSSAGTGAPVIINDVMSGKIWIMVNEGSTALPYESYGYKIPISSANTTTPIYLGEVETTRKIKKLVLTGTNSDGITNATEQGIIQITPLPTLKNVRNAYCTHYEYVDQNQGSSMPNNSFTTSGGDGTSLWFKTEYTTATDFKSYLAQQYAAGTPVIVWYVLITPETGIVNEPLRKIGDYADEVSGITIPTIAGANTIDIDTTLKPSEVSINYKGWHPASALHRFNGTSWN